MSSYKIVLSLIALVVGAGCATAGTNLNSVHGISNGSSGLQAEQEKVPNQHGWSESNCPYIVADGQCAHETGANFMDPTTKNPLSPPVPNSNGWSSANCAHIMADGNCAHPL